MMQVSDDDVPTLATPQLTLRPPAPEDRAALTAILHDPAVRQHMGGILTGEDETRLADWARKSGGHFKPAADIFTWCAVCQADNRVAGRVDLLVARKKNEAELAYLFAPAYWHRGFASESAAAVVRFGWEGLCLRRIFARVRPANVYSVRVLQKCGFQVEKENVYAVYTR